MKLERIDERDTSWEIDKPTVRAYFWPSPTLLDCIDISGASVEEALVWAEQEARRRGAHLEVAVLAVNATGERGLIWIKGGSYGALKAPQPSDQ